MTQDSELPAVRNRFWRVLKWATFLIVLVFVARHGYKLWGEVDRNPTQVQWGWLALAVVTSVAAWLPSVWYWRKLMSTLQAAPAWPQVLRAYYCGHLGKYLPGKAAVIVIRAALLEGTGINAVTAALTVAMESLTYMWAGTVLAIVLYPALAPHLPERIAFEIVDPLLRLGLVVVVLVGGVALLALVMRGYLHAAEMFRDMAPDRAKGRPPASFKMTLAGGVVFLGAWWIQGLTLGLTIQAVSTEPFAWGEWPFWTGAAAVALVGGFIAIFSPGGLGVREGLLMELLARRLSPHQAVLVAVLFRGVALAGEILAAGALYYGIRGAGKQTYRRKK